MNLSQLLSAAPNKQRFTAESRIGFFLTSTHLDDYDVLQLVLMQFKPISVNMIITAFESEDSIVFIIVAKFFPCQRNNSWPPALSLIKFCVNMYLDNLSKPIEY